MKKSLISLLILISAVVLSARDLDQYLEAYWSFDSKNANDFSGNQHHGEIKNNPSYIDGVSGFAMEFDGYPGDTRKGDHVNIPEIDFSDWNEFTVSLWAKYYSSASHPGTGLIFFGTDNNGWLGIMVHQNYPYLSGKTRYLRFAVNGGAELSNDIETTISEKDMQNKWVLLTMTYKNGKLKAYYNDKLQGELETDVDYEGIEAGLASHFWYYDNYRTASRFNGALDEVKIYSTALTEEEIEDAYKNDSNEEETKCNESNLVAHWSFDDGTSKDISGNNYHGTDINSPEATNGIKGLCYEFDGYPGDTRKGDFVSIPNLDLSQLNGYSISLWFDYDFMSSHEGSGLIYLGQENKGWTGIMIHQEYPYLPASKSRKLVFASNGDNQLSNSFIYDKKESKLKDGWNHVVLTYENNKMTAYYNGYSIGSISTSSSNIGAEAAIGAHFWKFNGEYRTASRFNGKIDEVKIFCKALTDEEVLEEYGCDMDEPEITGKFQICKDDLTQLIAPKGYERYEWSNGDTSQIATFNSKGNYKLTVYNEKGCFVEKEFEITEFETQDLSIVGPTQMCKDEVITLEVEGTYDEYLWNNGHKGKSIEINQAGEYGVTVLDENGCEIHKDFIISYYPNAIPEIAGSTTICPGESSTLSIPSNYTEIEWSNGENGNEIKITEAGTYIVAAKNPYGCDVTSEITVVETEKIIPSISGDLSFCEGSSTILSVDGEYATYNWSNGETSNEVEISQAGTLKLYVTTEGGCEGEVTLDIKEIAPPMPKIVGDLQICEGETGKLKLENEYAEYEWSNGSNSSTIEYSESGIYKVKVKNEAGCQSEATIKVEVLPLPKLDLDKEYEICEGGSITIELEDNGLEYTWCNGESGNSITFDKAGSYELNVKNSNGCSISKTIEVEEIPLPYASINGDFEVCKNGSTIISLEGEYSNAEWSNGNSGDEVEINSPGIYTVTLTNEKGCENQFEFEITQKPDLEPTTSQSLIICEGESITIELDNSYDNYQWSDGSTSSALILDKAGIYNVKVANKDGCEGTLEFEVKEASKPTIEISGPEYLCEGDEATLGISGDYDAVEWSNGGNQNSIDISSAGTYFVTVTNEAGCTATSEITIQEAPIPFLDYEVVLPLDPCEDPTSTVKIYSEDNFVIRNSNGDVIGENITEFEVEGKTLLIVSVENEFGCTKEFIILVDPECFDTGFSISGGDNNFNHGDVEIGKTKQIGLLIENHTTDAISIEDIHLSNPDGFEITNTLSELEANTTSIIKIDFTPKEQKLYQSNLTLLANNESQSVTIRGKGVINSGNSLTKVYPNPADEFVVLEFEIANNNYSSNNIELEIFDLTGRRFASEFEINKFDISNGMIQVSLDINVSNLSVGTYIASIQIGSETVIEQLIISD